MTPAIDRQEPLKKLVSSFVQSLQDGECKVSNGYSSYRVISIIEACQRSIDTGFREVRLDEVQKDFALINR